MYLNTVFKYNVFKYCPTLYTTTSLKQRMTAHTQNGGIRTHQQTVHQRKIKTFEILEHTYIGSRYKVV